MIARWARASVVSPLLRVRAAPPHSGLCLVGAALALAACVERPDVVATFAGAEGGSGGNAPEMLELTGDLQLNDPTVIRVGESYRLFGTGLGIPQRSSPDLRDFRAEATVFSTQPSWIEARVPGVTALWSPDVSLFGGVYHLYYAASTFGSDRSCIGHAATDDPLAVDPWKDHGEIICSNADGVSEDWNAIDPNVYVADDGKPWLVFGSYRSGIKLIALDADGERADDSLQTLWTRSSENPAIQASSLFRKDSDFYLFASFDLCCQGVDSTHKIMMGRARAVPGPYADRDGVPLLDGGGTLLLESGERFRGPGSNVFFEDRGRVYNAYHAYDADNGGRATLRIAEVRFDDEGWPESAGP
jgi:arabinan endo-1,5-alpha-L-arabinosidase